MKKALIFGWGILLLSFWGCESDSHGLEDGLGDSAGISGEGSGGSGGNGSGSEQNPDQSGLITAAEWNDLDHWTYWLELLQKEEFEDFPEYWGIYPLQRLSLILRDAGTPVIDASVELVQAGNTVWKARTDNTGSAELWPNLFDPDFTSGNYSLVIEGEEVEQPVEWYQTDQLMEIEWSATNVNTTAVDIAFVVDATGSMGDELSFLQDDMENMLAKFAIEHSQFDLRTGTVFYRDEDEEYLVKHSDFTSDLGSTVNYIQEQSANGGGNYPEAVHSALKTTLNDLSWSRQARTRIAFLILDAPPHYEPQVLDDLRSSIKGLSEKGVKLIPISASGVDKPTEFLMRMMSIATNSTYVFITNDSGIGNDHIEASVGEYEIEYLNNLMLRLMETYSE